MVGQSAQGISARPLQNRVQKWGCASSARTLALSHAVVMVLRPAKSEQSEGLTASNNSSLHAKTWLVIEASEVQQ